MVIKNVFRGIGLVLVMIGIFSAAMAITLSPTPSTPVTNTAGDTQTFSITIGGSANVTWYINGTLKQTNTSETSPSYTNNSASAGFWNVSAVAVNVSNSSDFNMTTWWWTVNPPSTPIGSPPEITGVNAVNIKDTIADITFTVNQSDAITVVNYSEDLSLGLTSTSSYSGTLRTIQLTGLIKGTSYNYSVFAINGSNSSYTSNSTVQSFMTADPTAPEITNVSNNSITSTSINIAFEVNQSNAYTSVIYSSTDSSLATGTTLWNNITNPTRTIQLTPLTSGTLYYYRVNAYNATNPAGYSNSSSISTFTTKNPTPTITNDPVEGTIDLLLGQSKTFKVTPTNQPVTVTWTIDGSLKETDIVNVSQEANYTFVAASQGNFTLMANASNVNGSVLRNWIINVHPKTYSSGNRIWDANRDMSTTYTWSPMSFYAFYYDVDDNVGNESLQIILNPSNRNDRNVRAGNLIYSTVPEPVTFKYTAWGKYNVIGFMADKYFAGYSGLTKITDVSQLSTINNQQLHKVLMDDRNSRTLRTSTTYPLSDGYALSLKDIGTGRVAMISITKDGGEVYTDFKEVGDTLVYTKKVGSISDLPLIVLHIGSVFMGTTESMVQIDGIFQISESFTSVNQNNNYGIMEITSVSDSSIEMSNRNSFTLSSGSTIDIMGEMKFIVAKNTSVLRFAPMVKKSGEYEVRGTISNNETPSEWTPLSFEGFYYNIDEDIGTEKLTITRSGRNIQKNNIVYSTSSAPVSYKYSGLGKYNVIGFMAEKYFAGYVAGVISDNRDISTMGQNQLHKVLIDDDTQRIIYAGSTLTLNEGYVLKIKDVNLGAGTAEVWLSLLKDGNEVDDKVVSANRLYIYAPSKVGVVSELPIIALRVENIFRGKEATAAFVKGTFQISESYRTVNPGETFNRMEVDSVSADTITMTNPSTVSLDSGRSDTLMGNMRLKVADSSDIRYYPYILVNGSALAANQLGINVPSSMMVKDVITISITSGAGTPEGNAEVSFDGEVIGTTNSTGKLEYTLTKAGQHNFTATKLGYESAVKSVRIDVYVDNRLNFELPEFIDQYIPVSIMVKSSGSGNATAGADVTFDGTSIGKTDSSGTLTYTFTESGTHNLAASKPGYITVQREITVRLPFTEFKALDINFRPDVVAKGQKVYVWANITNSGTKEGMLPVALIINETVVENSNITLAPGKNIEVNFSHKVELPPGNYTVEILGQKTTMPVKEEPLNLFLVVGIITILGAVSIFVMTSKDILSIEALKAKLNMGPATNKPVIDTEAINRAINDIKSKSNNAINDIMSKFKKK